MMEIVWRNVGKTAAGLCSTSGTIPGMAEYFGWHERTRDQQPGETLFKVLDGEGGYRSAYDGSYQRWPLPILQADGAWMPGAWMPAWAGPIGSGGRGYELWPFDRLIEAFWPSAIYEAELRGPWLDHRKSLHNMFPAVYAREARLLRRLNWDESVARLLACDCAEHTLPIWEQRYPRRQRPRVAIATARRYATGQASMGDLMASHEKVRASLKYFYSTEPEWSSDAAVRMVGYAALAAIVASQPEIRRRHPIEGPARYDPEWKWQRERFREYLYDEVA